MIQRDVCPECGSLEVVKPREATMICRCCGLLYMELMPEDEIRLGPMTI